VSLELINTIAAAGTFFVITVAGVTAFVQLRHLRKSNDLQGLMTVLTLNYEDAVQDAFRFLTNTFPERMQDPAFRAQLDTEGPVDRSVHRELEICDYFERIGSFVKNGLISEDQYMDCSVPELFWEAVAPAIAIMRRKRGPTVYENFEYLAMRSRRWNELHPLGNYPNSTPRALVVDQWLQSPK
jgi:hypothetical protein